MKNIIVLLTLFLLSGSLWASRPEIDSAAYAFWKRIDDYAISENGLWVKFRYVYIERSKQTEKIQNRYYFYNTKTGKTKVMENVEYPEFFAGGNWIYYTEVSESDEAPFCLVDLSSGKKIVWNKEGEPDCSTETALVNYTRGDQRIFWRLGTKDSVVYDHLGGFKLLNSDRNILYVWKGEKEHELRYGDLFKPNSYKVLFRDPDRLLSRFNFDGKQGSFELEYAKSKPAGSQMWNFDLTGSVKNIADTRTWNLPSDLKNRINNSRMLGDGIVWELDVYTSNRPVAKKEFTVKKDSAFELELWSWNDLVIQSVQAESGYRKRSPKPDKYVYNTKTQKVIKVCPGIYASMRYQPGDVPRFVLLTDNSEFQSRKDWQYAERKNFLLVNLETGEMREFAKEQTKQASWSPDGRFVVYFDDEAKAWYRINPETFKVDNITETIDYPVYDELHDKPLPAFPYGLAGWSKDGRYAYIYDRFDIWRVDMNDFSKTICYTKGVGRQEGIVLRFLNVYSIEELTIDESKPVYLELLDWKSRNQGIGRMTTNGKLQKDLFGPFMLQAGGISNDGRKIVYSRQSFTEGRNVWVYDLQTQKMKQVSDANPDNNGFQWGSVKMVEWTNGAGKSNQGLLYLPYGYDPSKKYPVIVNYYETHAQEMHMYQVPGWSSAMLDIPTFLSHGYVIFRPDVYFTLGEPAKSVYDAVVSGVKYIIDKGIADPKHIGVQGHSWSGCTVSQLITMTDMFCCASIGAGVVNLTEAYTALRIGSGSTRMFMYEDWQCRMGKNLWEDKDAYIRNSSIFNVDKITAPVLIMHNDKDEAVEYHEGRNLFLALRRLQKPVWLLNYKGEGHFIGNVEAQRDWSIRMMQFFDHYLKEAPAPRWMVEGININERGYDRKYDLVK